MTPKEVQAWGRAKHKYSQSELASALGVAVMTISRWERDTCAIPSMLDLALEALAARGKRKRR